MHSIHAEIVEELCKRLGAMRQFSGVDLERLKCLLMQGDRSKAEEFVAVLTTVAVRPTEAKE